jgi:hypothetical protein
MSKVSVDRELLDSAATWLEVHAPGGGCVEGSVAEDLRAILEQPAEAEGAVETGSDAWMALHLLDRLSVDSSDELRVMQVEGIVKSMGAALSAVTAERDRLESMLIRTTTRHFAQQWKDRADDKKLDECLSEGIAMLEAERDQYRDMAGCMDLPRRPAGSRNGSTSTASSTQSATCPTAARKPCA